ncbi:MAG TPA: GFA family protein [Steroidobacteraceae bacterium]|nr:GFA family protein [Steroidobacteraceae bacterium]
MSEQHYTGSCQCGAVKFEVDVDLDTTRTCNCSRCQRLGAVWGYTSLDKLKILSGEENLTTFTFNRHVGKHRFCKTCGIQCFATGSIAVVNANCLDGIDPRALKPVHADGRSV